MTLSKAFIRSRKCLELNIGNTTMGHVMGKRVKANINMHLTTNST